MPTAVQNADALMNRDTAFFEGTAPKRSLGTATMKAVHRTRDNAGVLEVFRSDGVTVHASQAVTVDAADLPIDELGGAA